MLNPSAFLPYIGKYLLLSQKDGDQGDTAQRIGSYYFLGKLLGLKTDPTGGRTLATGFSFDLQYLEYAKKSGWYRRTPDPYFWGSNPKNFSRDQKSILMLSMAAMGDKDSLRSAFMAQVKRFGFHQNSRDGITDKFKFPDITLPAEIGTAIRGLEIKSLSWLLWLTDLCFFGDLILRKKQPWDYDNMLAQQLFYSVTKWPTFLSKWAFKKYQKTDFMDRLYNYHCTSNGIRPLYDMFVETNNLICGRLKYENATRTHSTSDT